MVTTDLLIDLVILTDTLIGAKLVLHKNILKLMILQQHSDEILNIIYYLTKMVKE